MKKYAIITGASRGIGRAAAVRLAADGYNLVLTADKDMDGLKETAALLDSNCTALLYKCDVASSADVKKMFLDLAARHIPEQTELLVNNAGISHFDLVQDMTDDDWKRVMDVNIGGVFHMCREIVPYMVRAGRGNIINISSYWGIAGSSMESAYSASKGAVNAFTLSLAKELEPSSIRVNALCCEYINTGMNDGFTGEEINDVLEVMPSHRVIEPEEVADMISFIAGDKCTETGRLFGMDILKF